MTYDPDRYLKSRSVTRLSDGRTFGQFRVQASAAEAQARELARMAQECGGVVGTGAMCDEITFASPEAFALFEARVKEWMDQIKPQT